MAHDDDWSEGMDYNHRSHTRDTQTGFQTGGIFDDVGDAVDGAYDTVAGAADWAAGSTDEAFARQFDDEQGGGLWDGLLSFTPFVDQADSTTERQIEQGVIEEPDDWTDSDSTTQNQDGNDGNFQRSGTPTTDGDGNNQNNNDPDTGMSEGDMKKLAMLGGAVAVGGYALTKVSSDTGAGSYPRTSTSARPKNRGR